MDANWALFIATIALVMVGAWYTRETHNIVVRMDRENEQRSRPVLTFALIPWHAGIVKIRIQNVGLGPALDIKGRIVTVSESNPAEVNWSYPVLQAGAYEEMSVPASEDNKNNRFYMKWLQEHIDRITAEFTYSSTSGHPYPLKSELDVRSITADWMESRMLATQDHPDRISPRIAKALESIADSLKRST